GCLGAQGDLKRRGVGNILQRQNHQRICNPDLERQAMPSDLETSTMKETISPLAGKPAPKGMLVDLAQLEREYYQRQPDLADPNQLVSFGTSGHRGSSLRGTFTEAHILAITQAIRDYRRRQNI